MKTWDAWFPFVMVHAPTAPDPLVRQALCQAAREFCSRTYAWVEWLDSQATADGNQATQHDFDLPMQAELLRIEKATANGKPISVNAFRQVEADPDRHAKGSRGVVSRDQATFQVLNGVGVGELVQIQASLMPVLGASGVPDHLGARYHEALAEGAKSILLMVKGEFYDPEKAALSSAKFERAIGSAGVDSYLGHTQSVPRANPKWC